MSDDTIPVTSLGHHPEIMPSRPIHPGLRHQLAGAITCILLSCTPLLAAASCAKLPPGTVEITQSLKQRFEKPPPWHGQPG